MKTEQHETLTPNSIAARLAASEELRRLAGELLLEAASHFGDTETVPNGEWCKRFFIVDGSHMILTEEGWECGWALKSEANPDGYDRADILDEVNPPAL